MDVAGWVAREQAAVRRRTRKEILDRRRRDQTIRRSERIAAKEFEAPAGPAVGATAKAIAVLFDTEFESMLAQRTRHVIHELIPVIGSLHFGPIESADSGDRKSEESENVNTRQSSVQRIRHTGVQSICRGRQIVVIRKCRLVKSVV